MFPRRIERKSSSFTHVIDMSHCERVNKTQRLELWLRSGLNAGGQQRAKLEAGVLLTKDHLSEKQRHESTSHSVLTLSHTKNNKKIHIQLWPPLTFSVLYVFTYLLKYTSGQDILQLCISKRKITIPPHTHTHIPSNVKHGCMPQLLPNTRLGGG